MSKGILARADWTLCLVQNGKEDVQREPLQLNMDMASSCVCLGSRQVSFINQIFDRSSKRINKIGASQ